MRTQDKIEKFMKKIESFFVNAMFVIILLNCCILYWMALLIVSIAINIIEITNTTNRAFCELLSKYNETKVFDFDITKVIDVDVKSNAN